MANTTPVAFGAAGVPIFAALESVMPGLVTNGIDAAVFESRLALYTALLHGTVGTLVPLLAVFLMIRFFGNKETTRCTLVATWQIAPFAILGGLAFTIPYFVSAQFLTTELSFDPGWSRQSLEPAIIVSLQIVDGGIGNMAVSTTSSP